MSGWKMSRTIGRTLVAVVLVGGLLGVSSPAAAQSGDMSIHVFGIGAWGGDLKGDTDIDGDGLGGFVLQDFEIGPDDGNEDLSWTQGIGAQFEYKFNKYFSVGGRLGFYFVEFEDFSSNTGARTLFANVDGVVKATYPLSGGDVELYAVVPIGVSFASPGARYRGLFDDALDDTTYAAGLSLNIAAHAGFQYWISESFGIFFQQGLYRQNVNFSGNGEFGPGDDNVDFTTTASFNQLELNVGASFRF